MRETKERLNIYILAGGFGTRLSDIIKDVPKPMAPIGDIPFLEYQIGLIKKYIEDYQLILLTHYKSEIIEKHFLNNDKVIVIKEESPLGTGGAIKNAMKIVNQPATSPSLILNGDSYIDVNYKKFIDDSIGSINILCTFQKKCERSSTLEIQNKIISKFNKQGVKKRDSYISTGCYYLKDSSILQNYPKEYFMIENLFEEICSGNNLHAYTYKGYFIDIGIPEDYYRFCELIRNEC
tara:strand:- start:164 stop:871 length:708 start_codon:yes stop_codon:yes gene_type:complete